MLMQLTHEQLFFLNLKDSWCSYLKISMLLFKEWAYTLRGLTTLSDTLRRNVCISMIYTLNDYMYCCISINKTVFRTGIIC